MPPPYLPNDFREVVPSPNASLCRRFLRAAFEFPKMVAANMGYEWTDAGEISDEYAAQVCALNCLGAGGDGDGGGDGVLAAPIGVMASDGDHSDKVRVTWSSVTNATSYQVYRNTVNTAATATLLGEVTGLSFDDASAEIGQTYHYWVQAKNALGTSIFSAPDTGFRSAVLTAIIDLQASQGFSAFDSSLFIRLVFTPPSGAEQYDFYKNTVDDFSTAQLIESGRTPFDNSQTLNLCPVVPCTQNVFVDNDGELLYVFPVPQANRFTRFYFWVRARKVSMPAISAASNSAYGWAVGFGDGTTPISAETLGSGFETTVSGATEVFLVLFGGGAGGAGGSGTVGGGGGGGACTIWGKMEVVPGAKFRVRSDPVSGLIGGPASTDGDDGYITFLEYSADGSPGAYVAVMTCNAPGGGLFVGGGGGAGGAGASGSVSGAIMESVIKDGKNGKPGNGTNGGRSGQRFGGYRLPSNRLFPEQSPRAVSTTSFLSSGSGSDRDPANIGRGSGVDPSLGSAVLCFRT